MVVMMPVAASTLRTRLLVVSAMYTLPLTSTATARGAASWAAVAGPLSPEKPVVVPATRFSAPVHPLLARSFESTLVQVARVARVT